MRKTIYYPLICHSRPDRHRDGNDKEKIFLKSQFRSATLCDMLKVYAQ